MRAGGCTVQQTLTTEAASVLKHSLGLARRRGHAQVTPLHVAATMLSSRVSLLRRACLKSHPHSSSHPLQCRALELCFNVALNRLPTTPGPLLHGQPSLSNALIAALKRAQAHQRRGCIEQQQQQPLLAIKVELEQLIISILDDPSVSRVMREAGFSSTSVKNNLEDTSASSVFQCYSGSSGILPSSCPTSPNRDVINHSSFWQTHFLNCSSEQNPLHYSPPRNIKSQISPTFDNKEEDLRLVVEVLLRKTRRKNTVIIGDSFATSESLVEKLMGKVERGDVPQELRSVHFIKFQFPPVTLRFMKRDDVEMKIADLRRKLGSLVSGGGAAIIYAGDLKWTVELNESVGEISGYNPVEHLVAEIGRLLTDYNNTNSKVWLMATANYQTYMRCQMKQPSLEIQWALQPVSVPSGGLGLSLHASSDNESRVTLPQSPPQILETKPFASKEDQDRLTCCAECTSNFEKDAGFLKSGQKKASTLLANDDKGSSNLPYWMHTQKTDSQHKDDIAELRRKWNRLCHSLHHSRSNQMNVPSVFNKGYNFASSYSWWNAGGSQYNRNNSFPQSNSISFTEAASRPDRSTDLAVQFGSPPKSRSVESGLVKGLSLDSFKSKESKDEKITLALGTSLFTEKREGEIDPRMLSKQLVENVPWQSELIPSIIAALLNSTSTNNNGTWLLIQGDDGIGKKRLAQAIAESIYGSTEHFVHMKMRSNKQSTPCSEILMAALRKQKRSVIFIEEIDFADTKFIEFLSDEMSRENASFAQAIFIVTKGGSVYNEDRSNVIQMKLVMEDTVSSGVLDLGHKRKAEWNMSNSPKSQRTEGDLSSKKMFSRQSSPNTLDLNILAEEEDNEDEEFRSLTEETASDNKTVTGFLESIQHKFVFFNQSSSLRKKLMDKLKGSFEEVFGGSEGKVHFSVDEMVLEEIVNGGEGILVASLFENWLKDIFQTNLQMVKKGGKDGIVRLSLGDKLVDSGLENGYMGSNFPKTIQVSFKE
ncbi:hypothetical protein ACHQM5_030496 [Ranunculus cassubicifolius]